MNPEIDIYLSKSKKWQNEMMLLRAILLECQLEEALKWGKPCYTSNSTNIVIIQSFKDHCDLGFFNGALLKDTNKVLTKAGEHTQSGRQFRFSDISEIQKMKRIIKSYVKEAIQLELSGLKFEQLEKPENIIIKELQDVFKKNAPLKKAFESLTPGRQRGYLIYFSAAKQSETRLSRINNNASKIMSGKGINDCTCGLSKRMPNCDGSHKQKK
ncbi:MAG: hypothetical protein D4R41_04835 [Sediminibacterium sp.]|jgi:uncharacterized protein YdeI (YjbR/CyaY-like superfamily)|nr:MAG: hypothetical protein D4R41_04835 [Sediminibacterium sp.]